MNFTWCPHPTSVLNRLSLRDFLQSFERQKGNGMALAFLK